MIIEGLIVQGFGTNDIWAGSCCPQNITFKIKLAPNESSKQIDRIIWTDTNCGSIVTEVDFAPYADPLTNPTILFTSLYECPVTVDLCGCGTPGDFYTMQLDVHYTDFMLGSAIQTFYFYFPIKDINDYKIVVNSDVQFYDCINNCGVIRELTPLVNDTGVPLTITFNDPITGFAFYVDGNLITPTAGVYSITIPQYSSVVLQVANPGCTVGIVTDFTLTFNYCGETKNLDVHHHIVQCEGCDLYCEGYTIANFLTNNMIGDSSLMNPADWSATIGFGSPTITLTGDKLEILGGAGGYNEARLQYQVPIAYLPSSPQITFRWTLRTGRWDDINNSNIIYLYSPTGSFANQNILGIPFGQPTIEPNRTYSGTFTVTPWVSPAYGAGNAPVMVINVFNQVGKYFDITDFSLQVEYSQSTVNFDCSDLDPYTHTAIGDQKLVTYDLYYGKGFLNNAEIYFNPKLFSQVENLSSLLGTNSLTTNAPNFGWNLVVDSSWIGDGLPHYMTLFGVLQSQQNMLVWAEFIDQYRFQIKFAFYMTYDLDDWIKAFALNNSSRLLRNNINNTSLLDNNNVLSVYNITKQLFALILIKDPNFTTTVGGNVIPYVCGTVKNSFWRGRFWDLGLFNNPSEMTNQTWSFSRNVGSVTSLSTMERTYVSFKIDYQYPVDTIVLWLFDASNTNNFINFFTNYDSSRSIIVTNPSNGIISNDLEGPSTAPTNIIGNTYEITAHIGKNLNPNGDYYIGAICYSSTDKMVNSFLYHFDPVTNGPETCCDLDIVSEWADYNNIHAVDCYATAPKERYRHILTIEKGALDDCMRDDWGMPPSDTWIDYLSTFGLIIYQKVSNYPIVGQDTYFIHNNYLQARNTSLPNNWANNNTFGEWLINDNGTTIESVYYNRSRYEPNIPPALVAVSLQSSPTILTPVFGATANAYIAANNINTDWSNKDIYFRYILNFNMPWLAGGQQTLQINYISRLHPCDFETNPQPFVNLLDPIAIVGHSNAGSAVIGSVICSGIYNYLEVFVTGSVPDGTLFATIDFNPYGIYNIKEEASQVPGNGYFNQKTCVEIYDVQNFVGGNASFKIDMNQLPAGDFQICAIYIPY